MPNKETREKPRRALKVSHVLLVFSLIILTSYLLFRYKLRSQLKAKLNEIRASGYPVTCEELDEWYATPQLVDNAAYVIIDAFSFYKKLDEEKFEILPVVGKAKLPHRSEPLPEETKTFIAQYLADNQKALEFLHKGARIQHSRYPVDFSQGFEALMPYLSDIRKGVRLLQLEAFLHTENNEPELTITSIESMLGVARSLSNEPCLVSQLVNIACKTLAIRSLERVLNRTEFTDSQLRCLDKILSDAQDLTTMSHAFIGERCFGIRTFKMPMFKMKNFMGLPGGSAVSTISAIPMGLYKITGLADMDTIIYLDLMSDYIKAYQLPLHERQKAFRAIEAKLGTVSKVHIILYMFMPAMSRCATIDLRHIADLRTAQTTLAIQRYRLATGNYPNTLVDLVPEYLDVVPKDPFDGNDLRYKKLDAGFVVYSIGEDGIDSGGKENEPGASYNPTFIIGK